MNFLFAKVKTREQSDFNDIYQLQETKTSSTQSASLELHPDRQTMLDRPVPSANVPRQNKTDTNDVNKYRHRPRLKRSIYSKNT